MLFRARLKIGSHNQLRLAYKNNVRSKTRRYQSSTFVVNDRRLLNHIQNHSRAGELLCRNPKTLPENINLKQLESKWSEIVENWIEIPTAKLIKLCCFENGSKNKYCATWRFDSWYFHISWNGMISSNKFVVFLVFIFELKHYEK